MKLYHYTNLASVIGIIKQGRSLEFWASRYDCMNDPFDFQFAWNRIRPIIIKAAQREKLHKFETKEMAVHPYIVSFSSKEDDFLMWRLYNAKVCLILDSEYFERQALDYVLRKCEYIADSKKELYDAYHAINADIQFIPNIHMYSGRISTFIKNEAFRVENEVRLATWYYYEHDEKITISNQKKNNYFENGMFYTRIGPNGKIVIYKKFPIDGNALVGIIVHTYSEIEFESIREALRSVLIQNGFSRDVFDNIRPTSAYPFNL